MLIYSASVLKTRILLSDDVPEAQRCDAPPVLAGGWT